jgi:hypothetical protein
MTIISKRKVKTVEYTYYAKPETPACQLAPSTLTLSTESIRINLMLTALSAKMLERMMVSGGCTAQKKMKSFVSLNEVVILELDK